MLSTSEKINKNLVSTPQLATKKSGNCKGGNQLPPWRFCIYMFDCIYKISNFREKWLQGNRKKSLFFNSERIFRFGSC